MFPRAPLRPPPKNLRRFPRKFLEGHPGAMEGRGVCRDPLWFSEEPPGPSASLQALRKDVLELLQRGPRAAVAVVAGAMSPQLLLEACRRWRLTLQDLETLVLPPWMFSSSFPDRDTFFDYIDPWLDFVVGETTRCWDVSSKAWRVATVIGRRPVWRRGGPHNELLEYAEYDLDLELAVDSARIKRVWPPASPRLVDTCHESLAAGKLLGECLHLRCRGPQGERCRSARWVELLDGRVIARLMSDSIPTMAFDYRTDFIGAVLAGLRMVPWAPALHWAHTPRTKGRQLFLSWVGRVLRLNPAWTELLLLFVGPPP
mmetsp:Transcript_87979/g.273444  ORF Transcript_87979/g.273444 Transcript_87979/m.273444 type:complete len:315 (+) Transcript_87979:76-1020(+)